MKIIKEKEEKLQSMPHLVQVHIAIERMKEHLKLQLETQKKKQIRTT